ncbi:MAG: SDR family NAD(P)-dependent oxidoreductase [Anaerolineae bacterium]|nr:SDR family NAD(P)-dependent oxidoreductase [Anaerolineae bacterium]
MTNYLVTGGAGFIGSHLVQTLLEEGSSVRVLDNFSSGKRENLSDLDGKLEVLEGDIRDRALLQKAVNKVDVIFHQAAFVSVPESIENPAACFEVNVVGTISLFEEALKASVKRVVVASSAAVYGSSDALPLGESAQSQSLSPYAASKRTKEVYSELYTRAFGLEVVALRYFNVYGPRQRPDSMYAAAVPIFIRRLLDGKAVIIFGDGKQTRDLINVKDVVRANLIASKHPEAPGRVFNVCTGEETRLLDLLEVLYDLFPDAQDPIFSDPRPGDIYRSVGDPNYTEQTLSFQPEVSLSKGLKLVVEWMQA